MLYSCTHMATVGVKGLSNLSVYLPFTRWHHCYYAVVLLEAGRCCIDQWQSISWFGLSKRLCFVTRGKLWLKVKVEVEHLI